MPVASPLKYHGGKTYLAPKIISLMPPRHGPDKPDGWLHFVDAYCGGASIPLHLEQEGISVVINDIDNRLTNFWDCLADIKIFPWMVRTLQAVPFSQVLWRRAMKKLSQPCKLDQTEFTCPACGLAYLVHNRMSLAGRGIGFAPLTKNRTRRGMNEQASAWLSMIHGLPEVHAILQRWAILNMPAMEVYRQEDGPKTFAYLDPPYLTSTRKAKKVYAHEMSVADHVIMLATLGRMGRAPLGIDVKALVPEDRHDELAKAFAFQPESRFILSGYNNPIYEAWADLEVWRRVDMEVPNNAAGGKSKRRMVESVWMNYNCV